MIKKSTYYKHFRELTAGESQCASIMEWALELQTETVGVGFDGYPPLQGNRIAYDTGKVSCK